MKILDLPDSQDNMIRKELLKQDDKVLDDISKKSKQDIMIFLKEQKNKENELNNQKNEQDIQKIKSVFTPQILEQNGALADEFKKLDDNKIDKQKTLENILKILKDPKILKSITDQL